MKPKPDDRRDNVDRIQNNLNNTIKNIDITNEVIDETKDEKSRQELINKNDRRKDALEGMRHEIQDEAEAKNKDYKK